ncbi:hypothetical protein HDV00_006150 [Rhizophlyctis rosea]|nr:hypothetical protein HDV00_006150 [Rhizophlyctis rosea]
MFIETATGDFLNIQFPPEANAKLFENQFTSHTEDNILIPSMAELPLSFSSGTEGAGDQEWVLERMEWFGMVACGADRIRAMDQVDPFISVYQTPDGSSPGGIFTGTWRGFISAEQVADLLTGFRDLIKQDNLPWATAIVSGFRDAPVSWRESEHSFLTNGENDYIVLLLPDDRCVVYQAVGSQDAFSM